MNVKHPTIVIVNGANWIGARLVELLIEQKGNVIIVDDFTIENLPFIKRFADSKHFVFIEKNKIDSIRQNFTQIKYFIHLKKTGNNKNNSLSSKTFLSETRFCDEVLTIALEKNSIYVLTSNISLHRDFLLKQNYTRTSQAYSEADLQDYLERTVIEYVQKAGLDGRIVRLGNVYGPKMDLEQDSLLKQILLDAFYREEIRVYGDGLDYMYYVYISDAIQGILRSLFIKNTTGMVFSITNPDEISVLSIVNKLLGFQLRATKIRFLKPRNSVDPLYQKAYIPDQNLNEIGWKPLVTFDRGLAHLIEYFKKDISQAEIIDTNYGFSENNEGKSNFDAENVEFGFNDTLNLSNASFGVGVHAKDTEHLQFKEFQHRVATGDVEYKTKRKFTLFGKSDHPKSPWSLWSYIRFSFFLVTFLLIYVFFIVPFFRIGIFFYDLKKDAERLNTIITSNLSNQVISDRENMESQSRKSIAGVNWAVNIFNQEKLKDNLIIVASGLDSVAKAITTIQANNLTKYLVSGETVVESDISAIQDVLINLNQAKEQFKKVKEINLFLGADEEITKLEVWVNTTEAQLRKKLSD